MRRNKKALWLLLAALLCVSLMSTALAGGYVGEIIQNGISHNIALEGSGDGWSYSDHHITLNNLHADYMDLDEIVTLTLADGTVSEVKSLVINIPEVSVLTVTGTGKLLIHAPDYHDYIVAYNDDGEVEINEAITEAKKKAEEKTEEIKEMIAAFHITEGAVVELVEQSDNDQWFFFTDVPFDAYYADAVQWAVENGITKGTTDTTFSPDATCTRGQVVTFLWRNSGSPEPRITKNPYTDVSESSPFYKAILWATDNEITAGTSETTFSPGNTCTNAHVITFLWRYVCNPVASHPSELAESLPTGYYTDAVAWADTEGVLDGTEKPFVPSAPCSRADIVYYLDNAMWSAEEFIIG